MSNLFYDCDEQITPPVCDPCNTEVELGMVRSVAFIRGDYVEELRSDKDNPVAWQTGIQNGQIFIIPETRGSFDGGSEIEGDGYGHNSTRLIGFNFVLSYKDPTLAANCPFYNDIKKSGNWYIAFTTDKQTRISGSPITTVPKAPVDDDAESAVVWNVDVKWREKDQPCMFDTPEGVFNCVGGSGPGTEKYTFYYGFGSAPASESDIENNAYGSGQANLGFKAVVPDFGNSNGSDETLWFAEPSSEPIKTNWYNTVINNGPIGANETFVAPITVGGYRLYVSGFQTLFDNPAQVEFRL